MGDAGVLERAALGLVAVVCSVPATVLLLKAKGWLCLVSILIPVAGQAAGLVGCFRLAKPNSWWALNMYRDVKLGRARDRYPDAPREPADILAGLGWLNLGVMGLIAFLYALGLRP